jgi:hypothetical protein
MVMAMKALTTAFLKWQEKQLKLEALGNRLPGKCIVES